MEDPRSNVERVKDKMKDALLRASDSEFVDQATNAAADLVRDKGAANSTKLADRIDNALDDLLSSYKGFGSFLLKRLPLKRIIRKGIDKLVDAVADWLEDFSDASENDTDG